MFRPEKYHEKALEYDESVKTSNRAYQQNAFQRLEYTFAALAENEQWLAGNRQNTVEMADLAPCVRATLAEDEEFILLCLGAASIMQWNTVPAKL